jgi:hypothetical protein
MPLKLNDEIYLPYLHPMSMCFLYITSFVLYLL